MCIAVKRGEGGGGGERRVYVWKLSGVGVVYVLGREHPVPDCRALREQRLTMNRGLYHYTLWSVSSLYQRKDNNPILGKVGGGMGEGAVSVELTDVQNAARTAQTVCIHCLCEWYQRFSALRN